MNSSCSIDKIKINSVEIQENGKCKNTIIKVMPIKPLGKTNFWESETNFMKH